MQKITIARYGEGEYQCYRIPGVITTSKGTILVYYEERLDGNDWSTRNIGIRCSCDEGKTWSACSHVLTGSVEDTVNNPVMIACRNGAVHLFWQKNYRRGYHQISQDDGLTFSQPEEITEQLLPWRENYNWVKFAFGPCHGIEMSNGRLLIPVWLCSSQGNAHMPSVVSTLASDDAGKNWICGEIIQSDDMIINPNETIAVEKSDHSILLNIRHAGPTRFRVISTSPDGLRSFTCPVFDQALPDPICCAGLIKTPTGEFLFSNCANASADGKRAPRKHLTIRRSTDEGLTWDSALEIEETSGYSDLAVSPDGKWLYCFYEKDWVNNNEDLPEELCFAKIDISKI